MQKKGPNFSVQCWRKTWALPVKKIIRKKKKTTFLHVKSRRSSILLTSLYFWVLTIVGELSSLNRFQSGHGASLDVDRIFKKNSQRSITRIPLLAQTCSMKIVYWHYWATRLGIKAKPSRSPLRCCHYSRAGYWLFLPANSLVPVWFLTRRHVQHTTVRTNMVFINGGAVYWDLKLPPFSSPNRRSSSIASRHTSRTTSQARPRAWTWYGYGEGPDCTLLGSQRTYLMIQAYISQVRFDWGPVAPGPSISIWNRWEEWAIVIRQELKNGQTIGASFSFSSIGNSAKKFHTIHILILG